MKKAIAILQLFCFAFVIVVHGASVYECDSQDTIHFFSTGDCCDKFNAQAEEHSCCSAQAESQVVEDSGTENLQSICCLELEIKSSVDFDKTNDLVIKKSSNSSETEKFFHSSFFLAISQYQAQFFFPSTGPPGLCDPQHSRSLDFAFEAPRFKRHCSYLC